MSNKIGAFVATKGLLTDVDTTQRNFLGAMVMDDAGCVYIYMNGVASVAAGDWCMYGQGATTSLAFTAVRTLNDANSGGAGGMSIAMAAAVATDFGWFQVYGLTQANANIATTASVNAALYRSATTARLAASAVAKDTVFGAWTVAASSSNVGQAFITYPHVVDQSTL